MTTYLYELPNELLLDIISLIDDKKTLCVLARVSRRFQSLSEPVIYSAILLRTSQACNHVLKSIESSPKRATYIRALDLRPEFGNDFSEYGRALTSILFHCSKLQELTLESPTCNYQYWFNSGHAWQEIEVNIPSSLMEAVDFTSTRGLTKLELHLNGYQNRYWDPNAGQENANVMWSTIMALPTLNELTVSCACIHDTVHVGEARSTGLKKLSLIECNMTIEGLKKMLSAPKALENLYLGENAFHYDQGHDVPQSQPRLPYNGLFTQDPDAFISALAQQKDFLSQFTYITDGYSRSKSAPRKDFQDFTRLREVALSTQTEDLQAVLLSQDGPPGLISLSLDIAAKEMFDDLEKLHNVFLSSEQPLIPEEKSGQMSSKVSSVLFPRFSSAALQRLQRLEVILTDSSYMYYDVPAELKQQWIKLICERWLNHGVKFSLYSRKRDSIVPPILFGEEHRAPKDTLFYSWDSGFSEQVLLDDDDDDDYSFEEEDDDEDEDEDEDEEDDDDGDVHILHERVLGL